MVNNPFLNQEEVDLMYHLKEDLLVNLYHADTFNKENVKEEGHVPLPTSETNPTP